MKINQRSSNSGQRTRRSPEKTTPWSGFSLLELLVAMSVFLVVGGAAVSLVRKHAPLFNNAQNQTGLNIALRNAVAQLQMEVVNAGTGFAGATPTTFSPIGATITKATTPNCNATANYVASCFDRLSLISVDTSLPPLAPWGDAGLTTNADTTNTTLYLSNPLGGTAAQYSAWAKPLIAGTELMFVQGGTDVPSIALVVLKVDAVPNGNSIQITTTNPTQTLNNCRDETDTVIPTPITGIPPGPDPLGIYDFIQNGECYRFTGNFNGQLDHVVRLFASASYSVDTSVAGNPKLVRTGSTGAQDVIAEQIVGFTVGAWSNWRPGTLAPAVGYTTDPANFKSDWASVRSLQIQLIARTPPNSDNPSNFRNNYDQGPYQVQGISVVINPRNLNTN